MSSLELDELYDALCENLVRKEIVPETYDLKFEITNWVRGCQSISTLSTLDKKGLVNDWFNRMTGHDFLQAFLDDPDVTEIMLNGPNKLFLEKHNTIIALKPSAGEEQIRRMIQKMVSEVDRRVNYKDPIVDARLKCGARINVVMSPVGLDGPYLTIRKFRQDLLSLEALRSHGMLDSALEVFLKGVVKAKLNLFISGGTSSGKTTLLNCLCRIISKEERVISIEDSAELNLATIENLVRLETRPKTSGSLVEIPMTELIRTALRMRPDRMIVGEIRGREANDMLQALNTGHAGSMSTGHGNSGSDMLDRIETMALMSANSTAEGVKRQIASGIQMIIHLRKNSEGNRAISEILRVVGYEKGEIRYRSVVSEGFKIEDMDYFKWVCRHDQPEEAFV